MLEITDPTVVKNLAQKKQALEVRLSWELLEVFNDAQAGLIGALKKMVVRSIEEMARISMCDKFRETFRREWNKDWVKYACCTNHGINEWKWVEIRAKSKSFDAQECADWIRIFGEVMEKVTKDHNDAIRRGYQAGSDFYWKKYNPGNFRDASQADAGRRRVAQRDIDAAPMKYPSMVGYDDKAGPIWAFQAGITTAAGLKKHRVMPNDLTGKMDQVFGLTPGATISGTTSDNIFFIERFATVGVTPVLYLLPLAAIVSQGHHTLLECALPQTLLGINDYKVGLYSSLFPKSLGTNPPSGAATIKKILKTAEDHNDNRLMLIYNNEAFPRTPAPIGCFDFDRDEWQGIVTGNALMTTFQGLGPWPTRDTVERLRGRLGITVRRTYGA